MQKCFYKICVLTELQRAYFKGYARIYLIVPTQG